MTGTGREISDSILAAHCRFYTVAMLMMLGFAAELMAADTIVPHDRRISDVEAGAELARCEAAFGHLESARAQYRALLQTTNISWRLRLGFAETSVFWGDFHGATDIYREYLRAFPNDRGIVLRLAETLAVSQQFEEAEGQYRILLLDSPDDVRLLLGLAAVKRAEHDFESALGVLMRISEHDQALPDVLAAKGDVFLHLKRFDDAEKAFARLVEMPDWRVAGQMGLGRAFLSRGDKESASLKFAEIPGIEFKSIPARFYALLCGTGRHNEGLKGAMPDDLGAQGCMEWARLCQEHGDHAAAIECLEKVVMKDARQFSAKSALAQALATDRQFDRAIEIYDELQKLFLESDGILVEKARALSWARRYDEAISLYDMIMKRNPDNSVAARGKARVAVWAKRMDEAHGYYGRLLTPTVDSMLLKEISAVFGADTTASASGLVARVEKLARTGLPYDAYEWLRDNTDVILADAQLKKDARRLCLRFLPAYRIQKAVHLESREKSLTWRKQYLRALGSCMSLVESAPGNQEAAYDLSQLEFALGLDSEATRTTQRLLDLDPTHNLAPTVLARMDVMDNPYLCVDEVYWHELGRGDLADIERYHYDAGSGIPLMGRGYVEAMAHYWDERPGKSSGSFAANGFSVQGAGVVASWLDGGAGLTHKNYDDFDVRDTDTGYAEAHVNLWDVATLDLRRERTDELYNRFGIRQDTQADSWLLKWHSFLTRYLEIGAFERRLDYSDDNSGEQDYVNLAYSLTDHPRILKGAVFGEMRDTRVATAYIYDGDTPADIVHPYWTPQNYEAWGVMLEWYHDLSPIYSRGTDLRFYDLILTLRDDTEKNPALELKGKLHWELADGLTIGLEASLARSEQWDAEGFRMAVKQRF